METQKVIMTPRTTEEEIVTDDDACLFAIELSSILALPMVLKAAIELDIFEIIAKAGPGAALSGAEIAAQLPATNPDAAETVDRMLRLMVCYSILKCTLRGDERAYGLGPVCKYLTKNEDSASFAPLCLLNSDHVVSKTWFHLKDAVLEGGIPFNRAFGMNAFEYNEIDSRINKIFNHSMANYSIITLKKLLQTYKSFESLNSMVDVGGGTGASLSMIVSKYPSIKGINFDLPHVINDAPKYPGVEHVGGNMFEFVPKADAIFMKAILHNWNDEKCVKLLKNCFESLPVNGKVLVVDCILPITPNPTLTDKVVVLDDLNMLAYIPGGKGRTEKEFQAMATVAGFNSCRVVCKVFNTFLMEFVKD